MTARRGGRPKKDKTRRLNTMISLRLKDDLRDLVDAKLRELEKDQPEVDWTRGSVIRHMLYKGFKAEEAKPEE